MAASAPRIPAPTSTPPRPRPSGRRRPRGSMMTNLVDCDFDALRLGQPVRVVWTPTDGGPPVPMFTPR